MLAFGVGTQEGWAGAPRAPRSPGTSRDQISILCCPVTSEPTRAGAAQTSRKFCRPKTQSSVYAGFCSGGSGHCFSDLPAPYRLESRPLSQCVNAPPALDGGQGEAAETETVTGGNQDRRKGDGRGQSFFALPFFPEALKVPFCTQFCAGERRGLGRGAHKTLTHSSARGKAQTPPCPAPGGQDRAGSFQSLEGPASQLAPGQVRGPASITGGAEARPSPQSLPQGLACPPLSCRACLQASWASLHPSTSLSWALSVAPGRCDPGQPRQGPYPHLDSAPARLPLCPPSPNLYLGPLWPPPPANPRKPVISKG